MLYTFDGLFICQYILIGSIVALYLLLHSAYVLILNSEYLQRLVVVLILEYMMDERFII